MEQQALEATGGLRERLAGWFGELTGHLERARAGDTDFEVPHQIRVLIRRLRSAIRLVMSVRGGKLKGVKGVDRTFKRIAAEAGAVRDADVLEEHLAELKGEAAEVVPGREVALAAMATELTAERAEGRAVLNATLAEPGVIATLARAPAVLAELGQTAPGAHALAPVLAVRIGELAEHVERARTQDDPEEWHQVRISIKRVRYVIELLAGKDSPLLEGYVKMQSVLGKAHDHRVWQAKARATRKSPTGRGLDRLARGALSGLAEVEAKAAHAHELAASAELEQVLGAEARARLIAAFGAPPSPEDRVAGA